VLGDPEAALSIVAACAAASDADLLLFPEGFLQGYLVTAEHLRAHALDLGSPAFAAVLARLAPIRPTLVLGVLERDGDRLFNTAVVVTRGELTGVYRKTHLVDGESLFTPGDDYPVFDLAGVRFGINICYDTRFPAAAAAVTAQGARVLLAPSQNMMRRANAEHWRPLHGRIAAERARETGMWLIRSDVTGSRDADRVAYGPTCAINPAGEIVAQVPTMTTGMIVAEIS
jgi:predicted amidohydrolase